MDITSFTVIDLLKIHSAVLDELRRRDIVRSTNNPVSDLAEVLFCRAFPEWKREGNSTSGHDATDQDGVRYQIKARRLHHHNASRQLSAIRNLNADPFDYLAGVLFDGHYGVMRAALIPLAVVKEHTRRSEHTNSFIFILRESIWDLPGVRDVTSKIRAAVAAL
jgi:hypothetical protein